MNPVEKYKHELAEINEEINLFAVIAVATLIAGAALSFLFLMTHSKMAPAIGSAAAFGAFSLASICFCLYLTYKKSQLQSKPLDSAR